MRCPLLDARSIMNASSNFGRRVFLGHYVYPQHKADPFYRKTTSLHKIAKLSNTFFLGRILLLRTSLLPSSSLFSPPFFFESHQSLLFPQSSIYRELAIQLFLSFCHLFATCHVACLINHSLIYTSPCMKHLACLLTPPTNKVLHLYEAT